MSHIKRFEELDSEQYKNFLNKYHKSGYISTSSIKKLKELGLDIDDFSNIEKKVLKTLDFFRSGDIDLFYDYFMDIKDKYPYLTSYFTCSIDVTPRSYGSKYSTSLDKFNIIVSMDDNNLPALGGGKIDTNINVIDKIISGIENSREKEIQKRKEQMDDSFKRRPGADDHWAKDYMLRAKSENFLENCIISTLISFKVFLHLDDLDSYFNLNDEQWDEYYKNIKEERKEVVADIKLSLNDVLRSYFYSIGYPDVVFKVEEKGYGLYSYDPSSDIVVFNIQCELN